MRWKRPWVLVAALVVALGLLAYWWPRIWRMVAYNTGSDNCPPRGCPGGTPHNYNFNSGFGSIVLPPLITLAGAVVLVWWHNRCHIAGCWWPRLPHQTQAGEAACWIHHPERKVTREGLHARHHEAKEFSGKLDEIHRHVSAMSPEAGMFPPPSPGDDDG